MRTTILVISLLLFANLSGFATKINGRTFKPFKGKTVNLIQYKDYVTRDFEIIASTSIDTNGNFFFDYDLKKTQQAIIQIEYLIGIIYLDPNQEYSIYFPPRSEDGTYRLTRNSVNIVFDSIPTGDINGLILEFDRLYDQFLQDNRYNAMKPIFQKNLDAFKTKMVERFKEIKNNYFKKYVKYTVADLQLVSPSSHNKINKLSIYNAFVVNKKIDFKNHAQMNFLINFYSKTLKNQIGKTGNKINKVLTESGNYVTLDTTLKKDYFFKMNSLRELVIVDNLYSLYYDELYDPRILLKLLKQAEKQCESEEVKIIAGNIITSITKLIPGSTSYEAILIDKNNEKASFDSFKGKYVYINFWANWNKESLAEMDVIKKMKEEYGDVIEFVSINTDASKRKFDLFVAAHPDYNWNMLYYGGDANLLDAFEVFSIPHYVLLDDKGKIVAAPALKPIPDGSLKSIEKNFFEIKKKSKKKPKFSIGSK